MKQHTNRLCPECNAVIHGRIDKKFCDDHCRTNFHNRMNSEAGQVMRNTNSILRKNRRILSVLLKKSDCIQISSDKLLQTGFNVCFYTQTITDHLGNNYQCCYEFGFRKQSEDSFVLIKKSVVESIHENELQHGIMT